MLGPGPSALALPPGLAHGPRAVWAAGTPCPLPVPASSEWLEALPSVPRAGAAGLCRLDSSPWAPPAPGDPHHWVLERTVLWELGVPAWRYSKTHVGPQSPLWTMGPQTPLVSAGRRYRSPLGAGGPSGAWARGLEGAEPGKKMPAGVDPGVWRRGPGGGRVCVGKASQDGPTCAWSGEARGAACTRGGCPLAPTLLHCHLAPGKEASPPQSLHAGPRLLR